MADDFILMVKPVGSRCQLRCRYCYYLDTRGAKEAGSVMEEEVLEEMIVRYFEAIKGPVASFTWHGGEPTLAGISFFERALELERRHLPAGWQVWNSLQTNGLLLDEAWAAFLAKNHFDVGLSIDGDEACHDGNRIGADGGGTWERAAAAAALLMEHGIQPDLLCTVNPVTVRRPREVYRALRDMGTGWMQFIPVVMPEGEREECSVDPRAYGEFLKDVFSEWFYHDMGRTQVQLFSEMSLALAGGEPSLCNMQERCGRALVVERDGTVYACDHFVRDPYGLGNLREKSLGEMAESPELAAFGERKRSDLPEKCSACPYLRLCNGGCIKDRRGPARDYVLCGGLRSFFDYAVPRLTSAMALSAKGLAPGQIMAEETRRERERFSGVSRNDPCPCGSGKKFKACCLKRVP